MKNVEGHNEEFVLNTGMYLEPGKGYEERRCIV